MSRPRGPMLDWRPHARTRALLAQVAEVLDTYADHLPLTIRQVFYRLVGIHGYDKTEAAYGRLAETLGRARRAGIVEWSAIRDDGVTEVRPDCFTGMAGFHAEVLAWVDDYRLDRQTGQGQRVELWCEAAGMVPQLARVADPYGITVYSSSGFDSVTAKHQTALRAREAEAPLVVLHVGDHDPSGVHVFSSAAEDVGAWADHLGAVVEFRRVAVTPEQVIRHNLAAAPAKVTDRRSFTGETTQAEALDPATLAAEVAAAIDALVDPAILDNVIARENADRDRLLAELAPWR